MGLTRRRHLSGGPEGYEDLGSAIQTTGQVWPPGHDLPEICWPCEGALHRFVPVPDPIFADLRLARLYDVFDGGRTDLLLYLTMARQLGARSVLDLGCGTGVFALLASANGLHVIGVDPAEASLNVARARPGAERVTWHCGTVETAPLLRVDLAVMTGNVAQVFLTDADWLATLAGVRLRLARGGHLVYETRRLQDRAWERWSSPFEVSRTVEGVGLVRVRRRMLRVDMPLVSFRYLYTFPDGEEVVSDSTLRFRSDEENQDLLDRAGFRVVEVRDAPDRPGRERVYLAAQATTH